MADKIFLGLGSNKGDRVEKLITAVSKINSLPGCIVEKSSSVYVTEPYGIKEQEDFYNAVIEISGSLKPVELYCLIKKIERETGRIESKRWGPREIDIDILLYNDLIYADEQLIIPHKELLLRDFVIVPLLEIYGEAVHPASKERIDKINLGGIEKTIKGKLPIDLLKQSGVKLG